MQGTNRQQIEQLYREAVTVADRARGWFDGPGAQWRAGLALDDRARVATASLGVTATLMAAMAWLLDPAHGVADALLRPFNVPAPDPETLPATLFDNTPGAAIIAASRDIAARIAALAAETA